MTPHTFATTTTPHRPDATVAAFDEHRRELTAYAYRMLGSTFEAEDAVQEALLKAWRSLDHFEGRASLRTWLYRITTNVCLDMLRSRRRRTRPVDLGPAEPASTPLGEPLPEAAWIEPIPDALVMGDNGDPADVAVTRDSIRLALIAAIQHLPPRQRAVLILCEVLRWKAAEVAELLDTSTASVNSALQRARAALAARGISADDKTPPINAEQRDLLRRYVEAFERYDLDALTSLLHEDATWSMPPYELWLETHNDIRQWCLGPGIGCRGSRLIPVWANGAPAFAQYRPAESGKGHEPWSLQIIDLAPGGIAGVTFFLDTARFFPLFGLPPRLD